MRPLQFRYSDTRVGLRVPDDALILSLRPATPTKCDMEALAERALEALGFVPRRPAILVPDRTRDADAPRAVGALLDALERRGALGRPPACVFASGTHAPMGQGEMDAILGAARARVTPVAHVADDELVAIGEGPDGAPVHVNPAIAEADAVLVVSAMAFHYLAGFGGGRKMLLPGASDRATATAIHATCLSTEPPGRACGAAPGVLDDNPLHQAILARLRGLPPVAGLCVVKEGGRVLDGEAGGLVEHHRALARRYASGRTVVVDAPLDGLLLSCRGAPYDVDLVQAHKALVAVAPVVRDGGRIAWLAKAPRGLGHRELAAWLTDGSADDQLERLLARFHIGRQTAWSLRSLLDRFEVGLLSELPDDEVRAMGAVPLRHVEDALVFARAGGPRFGVAPDGAAFCYRL